MQAVNLIRIYQCLCDETRLRMLNLLTHGPLCVCHLQELLEEPQVKISKHLAYLKEKGVVEVQRHQNWMIYSLPKKPAPELEANLKCLQDCVQTAPVFKRDVAKLEKLRPKVEWLAEATGCCAEAKPPAGAAKRALSAHSIST
jgi:ArsR family transcriptional regulator